MGFPTLDTDRYLLKLIPPCIEYLETEFKYVYGNFQDEYFQYLRPLAQKVLEILTICDAPYHNVEHTLQVTLVGQSILSGKFLCEEWISPQTWVQFILSLLCHDIGYVKGACQGDKPEKLEFVTAKNNQTITITAGATGASLTPFHVDRSQQFVLENFSHCEALNLEAVQWNIEMTRFPIPAQMDYQDTHSFAGLARAADLIGQLADPTYLMKLPRLFEEFEETGSNQCLGYKTPSDLRQGYPRFYWKNVSLYLKNAVRYLEMTPGGQATLENLYHNRVLVEQELDRYYQHQNPVKTSIQGLRQYVVTQLWPKVFP